MNESPNNTGKIVLIVVGIFGVIAMCLFTGLAGFAASVFALEQGVSTAQVGNTGAIAYTTGYLDLLGGHRNRLLRNPWDGLDALRIDEPDHPLARISNDDIRTAFSRFTTTLSQMGVGYTAPGELNLFALSPAGTTKPTLAVPATMTVAPNSPIALAQVRMIAARIPRLARGSVT